jgi:uncharacterized membrane protein YccF (DUF307 family)
MKTLANILWHFPFLGFLDALVALLVGLLLTVTIVAAPVGLGLIQYARFLLAPFSHKMVDKADIPVRSNLLWGAWSLLVRILYFPIGLVAAVIVLFKIVGLCISIIGIPLAIILAKSLGTYFNPVGKVCVSDAFADEIAARADRRRFA